MFYFVFLLILVGHEVTVSGLPVAPAHTEIVHASVGDEVIVSCKTPVNTTQTDLQVQWILQRSVGTTLVHNYSHGEDQLQVQDESFRGRTELLLGKIDHGIISLRITDLKLSDSGTYVCLPLAGEQAKRSLVTLDVSAPYKDIEIMTFCLGDKSLLQCEATRGYPKAEFMWTTGNGEEIEQFEGTQFTQSPEGLFSGTSTLQLRLQEDTVVCCTVFPAVPHLMKKKCVSLKSKTCSGIAENEAGEWTAQTLSVNYKVLMWTGFSYVMLLVVIVIFVKHLRQKQNKDSDLKKMKIHTLTTHCSPAKVNYSLLT
uniref:Ig-like domain-containing protein n=2 Tax=Latimeria chalumnae TaxID=7897 RepID=H3ANT1_LATCH